MFVIDIVIDEDVVEVRGITAFSEFKVLRVIGFKPHFYMSGGIVSDVELVSGCDAIRLECGSSVGASKVRRKHFFGYFEQPEEMVRVYHGLAVRQDRVVSAAKSVWSGLEAIEVGLKPIRRFLIEAEVCGGGWVSWPRGQTTVHIDQIQGHAPDILSGSGFKEWEAIPALSTMVVVVETISGDYRGWRPVKQQQKRPVIKDAVRLVALEYSCPSSSSTRASRRILLDSATRGEKAVLLGVERWFHDLDPDVVLVFDSRGLGLLVDRFEALCQRSPKLGRDKQTPTRVVSITTYSKDWIRSRTEQRMASANNLETHRLYGCGGRLSVDLLRFLLMRQSPKLTTYNFNEAIESVLGERRCCELDRTRLDTSALGRLAAADCSAIREMAARLNCVAETVEISRATGLDLDTVQWQAASVRTEHLLLKAARRLGFATPLNAAPDAFRVGWADDTTPYLHHPAPYAELQDRQQGLVDVGLMGNTRPNGSTGLYRDPVAVLDFASLYPSIFVAHNICHSTLLLPSKNPNRTKRQKVHICPATSGDYESPCHAFVAEREGIVPRLLRALMRERKIVKQRLRLGGLSSAEADCLEARQLSLKMCANATYGYCGSGVSSLEGKPLAETCLRFGNLYCRHAVCLIESNFRDASVIYAQTDSVFVLFRGRSRAQAETEALRAAELVTINTPQPIKLEYQRVLQPFVLLQVNRYAGNDSGELHVKGVGSERGSPLFVRRALRETLRCALLGGELALAQQAARDAVDALTTGKLDVDDISCGAFLWRQDHDDLERMAHSNSKRALSKEDNDALRTPHVALAVRLLQREPRLRFRLGEFVSSVICAGGDTQSETVEDPRRVVLDNLPVNLKLYAANKLRPDLTRVLQHLGLPALLDPRKFAASGLLSCPDASTLLGVMPSSPSNQNKRRITEHFVTTPPRKRVVSKDPSKMLRLIAAKRIAQRRWAALMAERHRRAARICGLDPNAHAANASLAAPIANLARILTDIDAKLESFDLECVTQKDSSDYLATPRTLFSPYNVSTPDTSFATPRTCAIGRQERGHDEDTSWTCALCTYQHTGKESRYLRCAVCATPSHASDFASP